LKKIFERWTFQQGGALDSMAKASLMGLHLVSGIIVGCVIGYFLDKWLNTSPWFMLTFLLLGIAAGFLNVYRDTKRLLKYQEKLDAPKDKTEN
jgi:ATP synthase protein I